MFKNILKTISIWTFVGILSFGAVIPYVEYPEAAKQAHLTGIIRCISLMIALSGYVSNKKYFNEILAAQCLLMIVVILAIVFECLYVLYDDYFYIVPAAFFDIFHAIIWMWLSFYNLIESNKKD